MKKAGDVGAAFSGGNGTPERTRTSNLQIRNLALNAHEAH